MQSAYRRVGASSDWRRARFDPGTAPGLHARYEPRFGEDRFRIDVADNRIHVARGDAHRADATIDTDPRQAGSRALGGKSLVAAQRAGAMATESEKAAVERFMQYFRMPTTSTVLGPA